MNKLVDKFNRKIDYLRISVTDRCNLRCVYCMPAGGIISKPHGDILSFEDIYRIVKAAVRLGIVKVRITGGEPLIRKDIEILIKKLSAIKGLRDIALTTNGILLKDHASRLKKSGLDRVNVSLDSLIPEKFNRITRLGSLEDVLEGIDSAMEAGLEPVKINTVLIKGFNAGEVVMFAGLARKKPLHVRFIELMPTNLVKSFYGACYFSASEAKVICDNFFGRLEPIDAGAGGVARLFRPDGFRGTIGFISPVSEPFCASCNKLRLTSDGYLRSCLHSSAGVDLKDALAGGIAEDDLSELIREAAAHKPASHNLKERPLGFDVSGFSMCRIGG